MFKKSEINQLVDSIFKLFSYLLIFTKKDIDISIIFNDETISSVPILHPNSIKVSPLLFSRIDGCHGAGKCCMVPFDLIYTEHCYQKVIAFNLDEWIEYGAEAVEKFSRCREHLLANFEIVTVVCNIGNEKKNFRLYVLRNKTVPIFGTKNSCPYLFKDDKRFYCGLHPFKPLHCWMPHMTVRSNQSKTHSRPEVLISRLQYGRNHKFGCPVKFDETIGMVHPNYFKLQAKEDFNKFRRISKMLLSMGFTFEDNYGISLCAEIYPLIFRTSLKEFSNLSGPIKLWDSYSEDFFNGI